MQIKERKIRKKLKLKNLEFKNILGIISRIDKEGKYFSFSWIN